MGEIKENTGNVAVEDKQTAETTSPAKTDRPVRCEIFHDNFENSKSYNIPRAQMIIADIPFALGDKMYNINNFFAFATRLLRKEPGKGEKGAPCVLIFCSFEQMHEVIEEGKKSGFKHYTPLVFVKSSSPQVLKANMKVLGACEYGLLLYRDKLPKFNNVDAEGKHRMIKNWFEFRRDGKDIPRIHPTQKPVNLLKQLITIFTDPGDVVIDPCCGSGSTLYAARELGRSAFGFEVSRDFYGKAKEQMLGI